MGYRLVIAEKPSVAQSIAKVIGADRKKDGYLEGNGYLVSWCFGHLVELCEPQDYDEKYERWRKEDLPIVPDPFRYRVSEDTKKQFRKLKELMERDDVDGLIEATDAGREGELIFRLVYQEAHCRKPFERLWISSMEDGAIREGFRNLKPSSAYDALYEAALCRERADWLVGINATRLFSTLYRQTLNVGRVMTPTLAMLAGREEEIMQFKPEPVYTLQITAGAVMADGEKIKDRQEAKKRLAILKETEVATVSKMDEVQKEDRPPLLYDLTTLQRDANQMYGFTAQQTLDLAQSLYEKKLATYPRTDSRYLTDEMDDSTKRLACLMKEKWGYTKIVPLNTGRVLDSKKVSDHHAILPTENVYDVTFSELPEGEQKILSLLAARLLSALGNPCRYTEYHLEFTAANQTFRASAKTVTDLGWKDVESWILGKREEEKDDPENPDEDKTASGDESNKILEALSADPDYFAEGRQMKIVDAAIHEGMTKPKPRYTESTLLSAMERAGAKETPDEAERKGLGTPATRAGIIEKLVRIGFVERSGSRKTKYLVPTHKGISLVTVMPEEIRSPLLTADWEQKLLKVERKELAPEAFMKDIETMISTLVDTYEAVQDAEVMKKESAEKIGTCPACGSAVVERKKGYFCSNRECRFALWKENRYFDAIGKKMTRQIAESLLTSGKVNLTKCRSRKSGSTYDATLLMTTGDDGSVTFRMEFPDRKGAKRK
jgi:DNA topoisomerase-3